MVSSIFKKNFWQATKGSPKTRSASDSSQDNNHKKTRVKTNEAKAKPMEHWHAMVNKLSINKKTSVRKTREGPMPKVPVRAAGAERNRERTKVMIAKRSKAKITEMM